MAKVTALVGLVTKKGFAMPLIIEDGTGVSDANSYVDLAEARDIASVRGIALSDDNAELTTQLVRAADRITSYESEFSGVRTKDTQGLSFPRKGSFKYGSALQSDVVPSEIKRAQVMLADLIEQGYEIWTVQTNGIKREKVGPLETEYADSSTESVGNPVIPLIDSILSPFYTPLNVNFRVGR